MDNRRTPNYTRSTSGSASKKVQPKSQRKQDPNCTISHGDAPTVGSLRDKINKTVRSNLNTTICGPSFSRIRQAVPLVPIDLDFDCDLVYNDYLQALMRKQIIKKTIQEHNGKLSDQILIQKEKQVKLECAYKDIVDKINFFKHQTEIIKVLEKLEIDFVEVQHMTENYNIYKRLERLSVILTSESDLISVHNIKPIETQEEYDKLIKNLNNLSRVLDNFLNSGRDLDGVKKLADCLKEFDKLRGNVNENANKNCKLKEKSAFKLLSDTSDIFAKQGGYF